MPAYRCQRELMNITPIDLHVAKRFIGQYHYAPKCPPHCLEALGICDNDNWYQPQRVAIWGWGVRPLHTIQRLFPELETKDYRELNRLCTLDSLPRNTESAFIAACVRWLRQHRSSVKVLLSWADGMRGKPGYIYQAANWLYGGFIETEFYISADDEVVHPRFLITRFGTRSGAVTESLGLRHIRGRQFLYARFLCGHQEMKQLIRSSPVGWSRKYPKLEDCLVWDAGDASREMRQASSLQGAVRFRNPAPSLFDDLKE